MKGKSNIVLRVLAVLGIVVAVYAVVLGISATRLMGTVESLSTKAEVCQKQMEEGNIADSVTSLKNIAKDCESLKGELDMVQWQIASVLPVLGDDVRCVRGLATIGDSLANDALVPVLNNADELGILDQNNIDALSGLIDGFGQDITGTGNGTGSNSDAQKLENSITVVGSLINIFAEKSDKVDALVNSLSKARTVLGECRNQADRLPKSHFKEIQDITDQVKGYLDDADNTIASIETFVGDVSAGVNSLFSGLPAA